MAEIAEFCCFRAYSHSQWELNGNVPGLSRECIGNMLGMRMGMKFGFYFGKKLLENFKKCLQKKQELQKNNLTILQKNSKKANKKSLKIFAKKSKKFQKRLQKV